jgi:hypothetical protein
MALSHWGHDEYRRQVIPRRTLALIALPLLGLAACGGAAAKAVEPATTAAPVVTTAAPTTVAPSTTTVPLEPCPDGQRRVPASNAVCSPKPVVTTTTPTTRAPTPTTTPKPSANAAVQVTDTFAYASGDYWWFGAVVTNTGDKPILNTALSIEAFDDSGRLIDNATEYTGAIFPGQPYVVRSITQVGSPSRVQIKAKGAEWSPTSTWGTFDVQNLALSEARFSSKITGEVHSTFEADQERVAIWGVWRDPDTNAIVGIAETSVKVYGGQVSAFSLDVDSDLVGGVRTADQVIAQI